MHLTLTLRMSIAMLFLLPLMAIGQNHPKVLSVEPSNQSIKNAADVSIKIVFDEAIDQATVDYGNFKVFGRWSGPAEVAFTVSDDKKEIELVPFEPYFAGEWVTVMLTTDIQSAAGLALTKSYSWNFWIETSHGELDQELIKTLELRYPGEGLIQTYGAYAGDLNNDGYSDLTMVNETSDDLRILLNDGTGDYNDFELYDMGSGSTPSPNEGADFDGDGEIDLAVCTAWHDEMRILMGDGEGNFTGMETYSSGSSARGLGILDIDSDGNDDVIIANRSSSDISIFKNDGNANFTAETMDMDQDGDGESGVAVADANNDGIMDVFIGYHGSQEIGLYLGDGVGGLSLSDKIEVFGEPWMIAAGDLNGDGFVDVASANSVGNNMTVNFGDGQGNLSSPVSYQYNSTRFPLAIDMGDLDGDGDLDIVTSNYSSTNFAVFENDGQGGFTLAKLLPSPNHASCAILHDRDNDGDLDISGTDEGDDVLMLFENDAPLTNIVEQNEVASLVLSPNPFQDQLLLQYDLKEAASLDVAIYDVHGKRLANLFTGQQVAGLHFLQWNGKDNNGQILPEGVYVMMLSTDQHKLARKVLFNPR